LKRALIAVPNRLTNTLCFCITVGIAAAIWVDA
jgi:hypothetical protein